MRNNIDDHGQQKPARSQRKKQSESRLRHNTTSIYPAFLAKIIFNFATKMEDGRRCFIYISLHLNVCIKKKINCGELG